MTFEEYAKERKIIGGSWYVEIMMAWNAATKVEREACAELCEYRGDISSDANARAIRARTDALKPTSIASRHPEYTLYCTAAELNMAEAEATLHHMANELKGKSC